MTDREVKTRFTGDTKGLDTATSKVESGMASVAGKVASLAKGLLAFGGGLALGGLFKKAVDEAIQAEAGMNRLHKAVNNAGVGFAGFSKEAEVVINTLQRTTRATDDELRDALARLITITNDTSGSLKNLALVNDLAAFSGKGLEESAVIVGKAMMGNTRALKEFGITTKDSGEAIDQLSAKVGGQAEILNKGLGGALAQIKKQFNEVLEAIGLVVVGSDNLTTGTSALAEALADLAGWITANEASLRGGLSGAFEAVRDLIRSTKRDLEVLEGGLKVFIGTAIIFTKTGQNMLREGKALLHSQANMVTDSLTRQKEALNMYAAAFTDSYQEQTKTVKTETEKQTVHVKKAKQEQVDIAKEGEALIRITLVKMHDANSVIAQDWKVIHERASATKDKIDLLVPATVELVEPLEKGGVNAGVLARGMLDAAQAAGLLDDSAASALNSVITMGESIARVAGGDMSGIVGIVGSLANILSGIGSSPMEKARREILASNTVALERLRREFGNFNLGISGRAFAGAQEVFGGFAGQAEAIGGGAPHERIVGAAKLRADILKQLSAKGIRQEDLESLTGDAGELFKQFFSTKDPALLLKLIPQILQALSTTELGAVGGGFEDSLQALEESFGVFGTEDADAKLAGFKKLAAKFSPALAKALNVDLSTPEGIQQAISNLQGLFTKLLAGELTPADIGVSGPQFRALINTMLSLLRGADTVLPVVPVGTPPTTVPTGGTASSLIPATDFSNIGAITDVGGIGSTLSPISIGTQNNIFNITARPQDDPRALVDLIVPELDRRFGFRNRSKLVALGEPVMASTVV
jgi:hypothetical protein